MGRRCGSVPRDGLRRRRHRRAHAPRAESPRIEGGDATENRSTPLAWSSASACASERAPSPSDRAAAAHVPKVAVRRGTNAGSCTRELRSVGRCGVVATVRGQAGVVGRAGYERTVGESNGAERARTARAISVGDTQRDPSFELRCFSVNPPIELPIHRREPANTGNATSEPAELRYALMLLGMQVVVTENESSQMSGGSPMLEAQAACTAAARSRGQLGGMTGPVLIGIGPPGKHRKSNPGPGSLSQTPKSVQQS